jgi:hypothetical protein
MSNFAQALTLIGIKVKNNDGSNRDLGGILNDLSATWEKLTTEQKDTLSQVFAGEQPIVYNINNIKGGDPDSFIKQMKLRSQFGKNN